MTDSTAVQRELRALGNADIARHSARFFKTGPGEYGEGDRFLGIRVPRLRKAARSHGDLSLAGVCKLLASPYHEERLTGLFIMVQQYDRGSNATTARIFDLYLASTARINNWDLVDASAPRIVGAHLYGKDKRVLLQLAISSDLWERRIAIISCLYFIRRGQYSVALKVSGRMLDDPHDLIHKAVGWVLREIGKRDVETETRFLDRNYSRMPRTMLRYAIEKFPPEVRRDYLRGRI